MGESWFDEVEVGPDAGGEDDRPRRWFRRRRDEGAGRRLVILSDAPGLLFDLPPLPAHRLRRRRRPVSARRADRPRR